MSYPEITEEVIDHGKGERERFIEDRRPYAKDSL